MKNALFFIIVIMIAMLVSCPACQTLPDVTDPEPPRIEEPPPREPPKQEYNRHSTGIILDGSTTYIVKRGDSLSLISQELYGQQYYYPLIMMVADGVRDIDLIQPNARLLIPALRVNLDDPQAKEAMVRYFNSIAQLEEQRNRRTMAENIRAAVQ